MRKWALVFFFVFFVAMIQILAPGLLSAKPEYAAREGAACWDCHVNPYGGGVRTELGFAHGQGLALKATTDYLDKQAAGFGEFSPTLSEHLQFGFDGWLMWHDIEEDPDVVGDEEYQNSTFYMMEANFSLAAKLLPILSLVGSYDFALNTTETYGLVDNLPLGIYMKLGRFILPYGLRLDDHTAFTRNPIGFNAISQDTGIEVGIRPGPAYVIAAVSNGNLGVTGMDRDGDYYALTGQAGVRFWKFNLGGSYFHNTRDSLTRDIYGPYLTAGLWRLAYVGEVAFTRDEVGPDAPAGVDTDYISGYAMTHMIDLLLIRGLSLQGRYCFMEPNTDIKDDDYYQIAGGLNFFPIPYVETVFQYRYNVEAAEDVQNNEMLFQGHFYF